ncbi:MAG: 2-C-methyl-D-erythritol 2,4-cyclodiphosphate synthase [Leptospira sp.]|nr:2-C-methyl-D-erythritol 2,4-cyclodiphosphate synthase [Leptospira sp.]
MYRVGNGIDFHKLEINGARPFILGGYIIDTEWSLIGHSDADILLHAISDAILGALALGDIGDYFPDTDPENKNMNSVKIIQKVLGLLTGKKFEIVNVDSTIMAEKPKIAPHRSGITESLSAILKIDSGKISVKATTTEKMGALGRSEGIGVFSTVLLKQK